MPTTTSTPLASALDLRFEGLAAEDGDDLESRTLPARDDEVAGHLGGELTGGDDDDRLRGASLGFGSAFLAGRLRALEQRKTEAQRLAGAGLGLADDVRAAQGDGQGHGLDGEGMVDARV